MNNVSVMSTFGTQFLFYFCDFSYSCHFLIFLLVCMGVCRYIYVCVDFDLILFGLRRLAHDAFGRIASCPIPQNSFIRTVSYVERSPHIYYGWFVSLRFNWVFIDLWIFNKTTNLTTSIRSPPPLCLISWHKSNKFHRHPLKILYFLF